MGQILPLELLNSGDEGQVCDIAGEDSFIHRLAEMGLRVGGNVKMIRPGSPCIIAIENHRFSVRCDELAAVLVELEHLP